MGFQVFENIFDGKYDRTSWFVDNLTSNFVVIQCVACRLLFFVNLSFCFHISKTLCIFGVWGFWNFPLYSLLSLQFVGFFPFFYPYCIMMVFRRGNTETSFSGAYEVQRTNKNSKQDQVTCGKRGNVA